MKHKLTLVLAAAAMLASCGGNSGTSHPTGLSTPEESSTAQASGYLNWVAEGKIVIDLFDIGEARFTYGNAALAQASQTLDLNDSAALACSSQLTENDLFNFVIVTETAEGTGFSAGAAVYAGIEGNQISAFLADHDEFKGKKRAYVAISGGEEVKWTKGKNAEMDAKIQTYLNIK